MIKTDNFDAYAKYALSFSLIYPRDTTLNVRLEQLKLKGQPEIKCGLFYKTSKVYRLLVIFSDAQTIMKKFCDKKDCLYKRNKFEKIWSASIHPIWSILRPKKQPQAHWF